MKQTDMVGFVVSAATAAGVRIIGENQQHSPEPDLVLAKTGWPHVLAIYCRSGKLELPKSQAACAQELRRSGCRVEIVSPLETSLVRLVQLLETCDLAMQLTPAR